MNDKIKVVRKRTFSAHHLLLGAARVAIEDAEAKRPGGALTNVYFNMAWSHYMLNERDKACGSYDRAVEAYNENIRGNPSAKPYIPPGSSSFAEFIESQKRRVGC